MWKITAVAVVVLSVTLGCGSHCDNAAMEASAVSGCASGSSPVGYCQCAIGHIYDRYTCDDISGAKVPLSAVTDACVACASQYGFSPSDCHP